MAGRSDHTSILPRRYRRLITLAMVNGEIESEKHAREVRQLFIEAHGNFKRFKKKKLGRDTNMSDDNSEVSETVQSN